MSTHNVCFGPKLRKLGIPCKPQFFYIKVGFKGVYISRTRFPDDQSDCVSTYTTKALNISKLEQGVNTVCDQIFTYHSDPW